MDDGVSESMEDFMEDCVEDCAENCVEHDVGDCMEHRMKGCVEGCIEGCVEECHMNMIFKTANNEETRHDGEKDVTLKDDPARFQMTDVRKPLLQIRQLVDNTHTHTTSCNAGRSQAAEAERRAARPQWVCGAGGEEGQGEPGGGGVESECVEGHESKAQQRRRGRGRD